MGLGSSKKKAQQVSPDATPAPPEQEPLRHSDAAVDASVGSTREPKIQPPPAVDQNVSSGADVSAASSAVLSPPAVVSTDAELECCSATKDSGTESTDPENRGNADALNSLAVSNIVNSSTLVAGVTAAGVESTDPDHRIDTVADEPTASLVAAVEAEDWAEVESILRGPAICNVNARTTDWDYSLLRAAAEEGSVQSCRLLLERRANVNALDQNGMTPLMGSVVGSDNGELVALLLEARADAAASTDDGFTALKWATRLNRDESIALLRAAGMMGSATCF